MLHALCYVCICVVRHGVANSVVLTQHDKHVHNEYVTNSESYTEDTDDKERMVQPNVCKCLKH